MIGPKVNPEWEAQWKKDEITLAELNARRLEHGGIPFYMGLLLVVLLLSSAMAIHSGVTVQARTPQSGEAFNKCNLEGCQCVCGPKSCVPICGAPAPKVTVRDISKW